MSEPNGLGPGSLPFKQTPRGGVNDVQTRARRNAFRHRLKTGLGLIAVTIVSAIAVLSLGGETALVSQDSNRATNASVPQAAQPSVTEDHTSFIRPDPNSLPGGEVTQDVSDTFLFVIGLGVLVAGFVWSLLQARRQTVPIARNPRGALACMVVGALILLAATISFLLA